MDDTRELVDLALFARLVLGAAGLVVVAGVVLGALWSRQAPGGGWIRGLAVAAVGPAVAGLWFVYNAIEDRYGLDSVLALLINLALFVAVGALFGIVFPWIWRRTAAAGGGAPEGSPPGPAPAQEG